MSMTMSRPTLPSLSQDSASPASRQLPPLSALLNKPRSDPVSPTHNSSLSDLSNHKISQYTPMKTPIRLPSFDSLQFDSQKQPQFVPLPPHKASITNRPSSASGLSNSLPQTLSPIMPTPTSQLPNAQALPLESNQESPLVEKRSFAFISHSPSTFPNQEPTIDNVQLARRKRRRTTPRELAILQQEFEKGSTPNRTRRVEIAKMVDMTEKAVQIWFQNKRQSLRRQSNSEKEVHHLGPIFHGQPQQQQPASPAALTHTPVRLQPVNYNTPHPHQLGIPQTIVASQIKLEQPSSSPQLQQQSSPIKFAAPTLQNLLVTPIRTPRQQESQKQSPVATTTGSTLTFRINTSPNTSTEESNITTTTLTPVQSRAARQKPLMKVNPTIQSDKENQQVSPLKNKDQTSLKNRSALKSLSINNGERQDRDGVNNLLNLKHCE